MNISPEEADKKIQNKEVFLKRSQERLQSDLPPDGAAKAHRGIGRDYMQCAQLRTAAGQPKAARMLFCKAAEHYHEASSTHPDVYTAPLQVAVHAAVLCGDADVIDSVVNQYQAERDAFRQRMGGTTTSIEVARELALLAVVGEDRARSALDQFEDVLNPAHDQYEGYRTVYEILAGIVDGDRQRVQEWLTSYIRNVEEARADADSVSERFPDEAIALLVFARRRGLDVSVDSEFVPEAVYDLV